MEKDIKDNVKKAYGKIAREGSSCYGLSRCGSTGM